ncbi:MAG TPA: hypothetical protein VMW49_06820 [Candidatus Dormibacteraeota bacterium]|nr:hypothetical protein [Candidatus Dormibacteraeota bacterium]
MPGDWALLYLAFVISRIPDIEPWYQRVSGDHALWAACDFTQVPSYRLVHLRFTEMEGRADAFEQAAALLMQKARARDARVGAWWHLDASEAETHAAPQHDCTASDDCPTAQTGRRNPRMQRVGTATAKATRQLLATLPTEDAAAAVSVEGLHVIPVAASVVDHARNGRRFTSGHHWWFTRDKEAGVRAYSRGSRVIKAWHGFLHTEVIDHFTHAPLTSRLIPADQQESSAYAPVFERAVANLGGATPYLVAGDAGYSFRGVFAFNSNRGVGSVFPYRRRNGSEPKGRQPTAIHDEHGIPMCRRCGGETDFVRFAVVNRKGRLWFRCRLPQAPACQADQSILCDQAPRHLLPVWRTEAAYAAMRVSHQSYEHKHRDLRIQYLLAPDCLALRPKRPGMAWQQLRASAALLIEWLRVFQRAGWGGKPAVVGPARATGGGTMVARLLQIRGARRAAARAPTGADPPIVLVPPTA